MCCVNIQKAAGETLLLASKFRFFFSRVIAYGKVPTLGICMHFLNLAKMRFLCVYPFIIRNTN